MSVRVGWAAVGFGAGDLAVLLYVPIALPLVGAQTLGVAGSEGRATRQHRVAGGLSWTSKSYRVALERGAREARGGKCNGLWNVETRGKQAKLETPLSLRPARALPNR